MSSPNRRTFLAASAAGLATASYASANAAANKVVVGIMGTGGRGTAHAVTFAGMPNVEVAYVCDVDTARAEKAAKAVETKTKQTPKVETDFRKMFDDKAVDAIVVATCNHWHAPATILACTAKKHVYVEKPCSHNPLEGEMMIAAAKKNDCRVQMGNQRRSFVGIQEAMQKLHEGVIGRAYLAQAWYTNTRKSIGKGEVAAVPAGLDYELWQGPAPRREFKNNYLHYNWHWFWNWGNGELGNNGIHTLDLCRWGLQAEYPTAVTSFGGNFRYVDDQETPDTHIVGYDLPGKKSIAWEGLSRNNMPNVKQFDVQFLGENGSLSIVGNGYTVQDLAGKETGKGTGPGGDKEHVSNFLEAIRGNAKLNSEITEGHKSTMFCHLGNIAHRTGRRLLCDEKDGKVINDPEAMKIWTREYAPGWEPKV